MLSSLAKCALGVLGGLLLSGLAAAGNCTKTGQRCLDATLTKTISGITVSVDQVGGCWEYEDTYTCLKPNAVNYCQPLASLAPTCWQTSTSCIKQDTLFNAGCMESRQTWRCNNPALPTPQNTIKLSNSYTLTQTKVSQCDAGFVPANCSISSHTCLDQAPCKVDESGATVCLAGAAGPAGALHIADTCWQWDDTYSCIGETLTDCKPLRDKGCVEAPSTAACVTVGADGICRNTSRQFSCIDQPGSTTTVTDCSNQMFCVDGLCFDSGHSPNADMGRVIAAMETAREGGTYMDGAFKLFSGVAETCEKGYFGLKNCCKSSGGAKSNRDVLGTAVVGAVAEGGNAVGAYATYKATPYVYDFMYKSGFTDKAVGGMMDFAAKWGVSTCAGCDAAWLSAGGTGVGVVGDLSFSGSIASLYGMSLSYGSAAAAGVNSVALGGSATTAASSLGLSSVTASDLGTAITSAFDTYNFATTTVAQAGNFTLSFNPYALAASIAIQVIMDLMTCEPESQMLAMHRGANLSHYVGSYCSNELNLGFTKICLVTTETYCSYNSRLARIINEQGRAQIGKGWGSAENPSCGGFGEEEFTSLDFGQLDLSEFLAEIKARTPDVANLQSNINSTIQRRFNNYYGQ